MSSFYNTLRCNMFLKYVSVFANRSTKQLTPYASDRGQCWVQFVFVLYKSRLLETTVMLLMAMARAAKMG